MKIFNSVGIGLVLASCGKIPPLPPAQGTGTSGFTIPRSSTEQPPTAASKSVPNTLHDSDVTLLYLEHRQTAYLSSHFRSADGTSLELNEGFPSWQGTAFSQETIGATHHYQLTFSHPAGQSIAGSIEARFQDENQHADASLDSVSLVDLSPNQVPLSSSTLFLAYNGRSPVTDSTERFKVEFLSADGVHKTLCVNNSWLQPQRVEIPIAALSLPVGNYRVFLIRSKSYRFSADMGNGFGWSQTFNGESWSSPADLNVSEELIATEPGSLIPCTEDGSITPRLDLLQSAAP